MSGLDEILKRIIADNAKARDTAERRVSGLVSALMDKSDDDELGNFSDNLVAELEGLNGQGDAEEVEGGTVDESAGGSVPQEPSGGDGKEPGS